MTPTELRELAERGLTALQQLIDRKYSLHVPPQPNDHDLVIADCLKALRAIANEKERAVGGITREVVKTACDAAGIPWDGDDAFIDHTEIRLALQSAALALQPTAKLRALVEKWRMWSRADDTEYAEAYKLCADELSALLGE